MIQPKIINKTGWDTKDLKRLCAAVIRHKGSHKKHQIIIKHIHNGKRPYGYNRMSGCAYYHDYRITMRIPPITHFVNKLGDNGISEWKEEPTTLDVNMFARVLSHEIDHNLGLRHDVMLNVKQIDTNCVNGMTVNPAAPKQPKPKVDLVAVRAAKAAKKVEELQRKLSRYNKLLKKWQRKVSYYKKVRP